MNETSVLLTTPTYPYPTLPANDSLTDATGQRFTKGDDLFTIVSHTHCYANHILAQNVKRPVSVLEYPRWEDFTQEVDKGYGVVGISSYPPHLDRVMEMCRYVRERSPQTKILLGSYGAMAFNAAYDEKTRSQYVDELVLGEGVRFFRRFLGEEPDGPIRQALMPKAGGAPPYVSRFPQGNIGFLVSGLGCIGGCDFCSSTTLFDRKRIELLSPQELVEHIHLYYQHFPQVSQVFVIEEDHFRQPEYLFRMRDYWKEHPEVVERLDWFGFGSIDYIGRFAEKYGWDTIAEIGLGAIFIGVESKFAGDHGYEKRHRFEAREVFDRLHGMGIRTIGAWMCGWDFHNHTNVEEDLNYFVSLQPTYQQLTRVSPFPGTPLWEKLLQENRVRDVPWEDVHFWSGAQKNVVLEAHETLNITERGYDLLYRTWGPSILRRLDVELSGLEFCRASSNPLLHTHRARFLRRHCAMLWTSLRAMDRFAPNGVVRRRVRKTDERYRAVVGEPTPVMESLASALSVMVGLYKVRQFYDPLNRHPKEEPFKRYLYDNNGNGDAAIPYRVETPRPTRKIRSQMRRDRLVQATVASALRAVKFGKRRKGDSELDDYLVTRMREGMLSFGF